VEKKNPKVSVAPLKRKLFNDSTENKNSEKKKKKEK
jgi:hypothetical protein